MARPLAALPCTHPRRRLAAALLGAALALAACRSTPPTGRVADGHEGAPGVQGFLLVPMNLVIALPAELEAGVGPVQEAIVANVVAHGRRVQQLPLAEARVLWQRAIEVARAQGPLGFEPSVRAFVAEAAAHYEFEALLIPSLILQRTVVRHRSAAWDGVQRRIRLVNRPREPVGRNENAVVQGMAAGSLNANISIVSLHLLAFARDGRHVFEGRGGIDILEEVDLEDAHETFRFELRPRSDVFEDRAIVREAVEIALTPYLPRLVPR